MKRYWIVYWLERWKDDGTVKAFKTAVHSESLAEAVRAAENELGIRAKANGSECWIYKVSVAALDAADIIGKAETEDFPNAFLAFMHETEE